MVMFANAEQNSRGCFFKIIWKFLSLSLNSFAYLMAEEERVGSKKMFCKFVSDFLSRRPSFKSQLKYG